MWKSFYYWMRRNHMPLMAWFPWIAGFLVLMFVSLYIFCKNLFINP